MEYVQRYLDNVQTIIVIKIKNVLIVLMIDTVKCLNIICKKHVLMI